MEWVEGKMEAGRDLLGPQTQQNSLRDWVESLLGEQRGGGGEVLLAELWAPGIVVSSG